jgi:O-antigen ligase
MAKKRRSPAARPDQPVVTPPPPAATAAPAKSAAPATLPAEVVGGDWTVPLLALMMFMAPALGVPHEEMLQDTLKSAVVSFSALGAALLFFLGQRSRTEALRWHAVQVLPLMLMVYALGSMAWSHTYLGGVEAVRWFIFGLLLWLGLNTLSRERVPLLAWGIHGGVVVASLWTALQFWFDFKLFPQGPNPASTFVNRNFFAEFAVSTLPFTALLLARARQSAHVALLAVTGGFVMVAILMTGTRAALIALWLQLLVVLPLIGWRYRRQLAFGGWSAGLRLLAAGGLLVTVVAMGMIPSGNAKIVEEGKGVTALERAFHRTQEIRTDDTSLGLRMIMWRATLRVIADRPLSGVGAGAWENEIPLYQERGAQLETDYYVHNEFLQLVAEYGLVGWLFLAGLLGYLSLSAWRTWRAATPEALAEAPLRAFVLCSLLALLIVSNIGFPWRMASTGALFALSLAALAASDARLGFTGRAGAHPVRWQPVFAQAGLVATAGALVLATVIAQRAAESESKIVKAARIALTITASGEYNAPRWKASKQEMLDLIRQGTDINPHYRKITPLVADELGRWGDWANAVWIWESVLSSRPHVVAIITNVARGYMATGRNDKALAYLNRAKLIQPDAAAVRSLEVVLLSRTGQDAKALALAKDAMAAKAYDFDLISAAFVLATRAGDYPLALQAMQLRLAEYPWSRGRGYFQLGYLYHSGLKDPERALDAFKRSLELARPNDRQELLQQLPSAYWTALGYTPSTPAASTQTSASSK